MSDTLIGIIGGTGLGHTLVQEAKGESISVDTPFGATSGPIIRAEWAGAEVAFLARHGPGHTLHPSQVPYRANIWAMKKLGVRMILASGATGSLQEQIEPGQLVICDQVIDKTYRRVGTYFDEPGIVAHVALADPFCPWLRGCLQVTGAHASTKVHPEGTYVCMEGPQFSTRAEAHLHRSWGAHLIGMTCMPEAKLAREAELCYALIALPTDYDCWRPAPPGGHDALVKEVLANLNRSTAAGIELMRAVLPTLASMEPTCGCGRSLDLAVWSDIGDLPAKTRTRLEPILSRYLAEHGSK